jgi:hypothetical protein
VTEYLRSASGQSAILNGTPDIKSYFDSQRFFPWRYGVPSVLPGRAFVAGSLIVFSLLSYATDGQAQQVPPPQPRNGTVPALEALPHIPMPRGRFLGWCGLDDKIVLEVGRGKEIYNGGVKASPLSFPPGSTLNCGDDGQKLAFIDDESGRVSEVDIPGGIVTRTLATYDKALKKQISFSPDLKSVASRQPLTLASSAVKLNVIALSGPGRRAIGRVQWSRDSSALFGISAPEGKSNSEFVEILNAQGQKIGSGALPAGFLFSDGWLANSQTLYLYLSLARDEFGAGFLFRCRIAAWKCEQIASNVLAASVGGDGILAMVRAIGKYSNDGETEKYPSGYLVEIRNRASQVVVRQTFKSAERDTVGLAVAPSGKKAVLTWHENFTPGCTPEKRQSGQCKDGIVIDISEIIK